MQLSSIFPELNSGRKPSRKPKAAKAAKAPKAPKVPDVGTSGQSSFGYQGPRVRMSKAPKTLMGRRNASHAKAYCD